MEMGRHHRRCACESQPTWFQRTATFADLSFRYTCVCMCFKSPVLVVLFGRLMQSAAMIVELSGRYLQAGGLLSLVLAPPYSVCTCSFPNPISPRVLERLQIVVPEFEDWKRDMFELQARQKFQGVDIPPETGLHNPNAKLKTMEELLAESPIPLAPRR